MSDNVEISQLVLNAKRLAQLNDFSNEAILANERILALVPNDIDAHNRIARCHMTSERFDDAAKVYVSVLQLDPGNNIARRGLQEIEQSHRHTRGNRNREVSEWRFHSMVKSTQPSKLDQLSQYQLKHVYHLTHIDNLVSILANGIVPKATLDAEGIEYEDVADESVQDRRHVKQVPGTEYTVHEMVPVFFRTLTPMLYTRQSLNESLCILDIDVKLISQSNIECIVCDGNAASTSTKFYRFNADSPSLHNVPWEVLKDRYWHDKPDGKRKVSAELLIWPSIPTAAIQGISVAVHSAQVRVKKIIAASGFDFVRCKVDADSFFWDKFM